VSYASWRRIDDQTVNILEANKKPVGAGNTDRLQKELSK
jgi:hypothetical protein